MTSFDPTNRFKPANRISPYMATRPRQSSLHVPDWRRHYDRLMTRPTEQGIARRRFLQSMMAAGALTATGVQWLAGAPRARALGPNERVLVTIMFGGGNDGMSMVAPAEDGRYHDARGPLALSAAMSIPLEQGLYWHPNLTDIAARYNAGDIAVVQGIGDPVDDHSHFSSMARWMRGAHDGASFGFSGWLGRWLDGAGAPALGGIAVGDSGTPLHMRGLSTEATSLSSYGNLYGADVDPWERPAIDAIIDIADSGPDRFWPTQVADAMATAIGTATEVAPIYDDDNLPEYGIVRDLGLAAEAINLDVGARVLTVGYGGFDTHADHKPDHDELMLELDQGITEFFNRLSPEFADRVAIMTFSEFGRSWTANASAGVDHGTSSTALVIGNTVQGGLYGQMPDLSTFDDWGDLESTVDFRSLYATMLDGWLNADSQEILGAQYENLAMLSSGPTLFGDADCTSDLSILDAMAIAQYEVGLRTGVDTCPLTDPAAQIHLTSGDFNRDGEVNVIDAMQIAQCLVGIDNPGCPPDSA